jgi:diguanylate cyclase (GGDEF)-like protein/PAS domain S-box-containing protein
LAPFATIILLAEAVVAGALSRLSIGGSWRIGLDAALMAFVCAPTIGWRVRALLRESVSAEATKFRALVDAAPEGIIGVGKDGRIQFANAESQRLFQYAESELLRRPVEVLIPDRFLGKHVHTRTAYVVNPKRRRMSSGFEVMARRKDGSEFPADISLSHVNTAAGALVISIIRDVTAERQAHKDLIETNQKLELGLAQHMRRTEELRQLSRMAEDIQGCSSEHESLEVVSFCTGRLFPDYTGALYMIGASGDPVAAVKAWGPEASGPVPFCMPKKCAALHSRRPCAAASGTVSGCEHATPERDLSYFCVPILARGEVLGMLRLSRKRGAASSRDLVEPHLEILQAIADQVGLSIANLRLRDALRLQSISDPLTDLYNRRFMDEWLSCELPHCTRKDRPISLLILDIDHFKRFNDTYGHECGDLVLREIGALLRGSVRQSDIACRIGGEELVLLLPDTALSEALATAEKLRMLVEALRVTYRGQPLAPITVSIGVAESPRHGSSASLLLRAADGALYEVKTTGRNRVAAAVDGKCESIANRHSAFPASHARERSNM